MFEKYQPKKEAKESDTRVDPLTLVYMTLIYAEFEDGKFVQRVAIKDYPLPQALAMEKMDLGGNGQYLIAQPNYEEERN
jgi:hypothetical protein